MQLTLRSARRLDREIEVEVQNLLQTCNNNRVNISIYQIFDDVIDSIQTEVIKVISLGFKLSEIRAKIRKMIESENEKSGLNILINEEALLRIKIKFLTAAMSAELTPAEKMVCKLRHTAMQNAPSIANAYGNVLDTVTLNETLEKDTLDNLKKQAREVQQKLLKLVDSTSAINTTQTIILSDDDTSFLLANNFVM